MLLCDTLCNRMASSKLTSPAFPLWVKVPYTLFVAVLIPVYWVKYGPQNFLWFSDYALFGSLVALWAGSRLIASMMAVAVLVPEVVWNVSFLGRLVLGVELFGLAGYMFDQELPLYLRGLSLFHVILPPLLVWMVWRLGYDRRALAAQTGVMLIVLPATYLLTDPQKNINWVFGPGSSVQEWLHPLVYLAIVMLLYFVVFYMPAHLLLKWMFSKVREKRSGIDPPPPGA